MSTNQSAESNRLVWQSKSWQMRTERVTLPDGSTTEKAYIDHPGAVVLVPIMGETVLMLRQYRLPFHRKMLECPAGTREVGEDWLTCAQRELREETGYRAARFIPLGEVLPVLSYSNEVLAIFLALDLTPDPLPQDDDEEIEIRPMPLAQLVTMALSGDLRDAKSVAGILRAAHYLDQ